MHLRIGGDRFKSRNGTFTAFWLLSFAATMVLTACETLKKGEKEQEAIVLVNLNLPYHPKCLNPRKDYFHRLEVERLMTQHLQDEPPSSIMVVTGTKTVGKSAVLDNILARNVDDVSTKEKGPRKGVVVVHLNKNDVLNIDKRIVTALGADPEQVYNHRDFIVRVCKAFNAEHGYRPVIVLRATADLSGTHALTMTSALSRYSRDTHAAVTIIDLLTIKTAVSMLQEWRAFSVTVPELTQEQVESYLGEGTLQRLAQDGVSLSQIMSTIGGNPVLLDDLIASKEPQQHLQVLVDEASVDLRSYLEKYPTHRAAVVALSGRPYEYGVSLKDYNAIAKASLRVLDLAELSSECLQYNLEKQTVVFSSRAHHVAAQALRKTQHKMSFFGFGFGKE